MNLSAIDSNISAEMNDTDVAADVLSWAEATYFTFVGRIGGEHNGCVSSSLFQGKKNVQICFEPFQFLHNLVQLPEQISLFFTRIVIL